MILGGFTALSERLSPSETISLINRYIEVQAEYLLQYGGSIDKYMGDAVLVVFEGEYREHRALSCAKDILTAIKLMNQQSKEAVQIGIGVSCGRVVMGNMGCEARMEHTVIGSTVNLAARLCSVANESEIVVQKRLVESIQEEDEELYSLFKEQEELIVKGFSKSISVKRVSFE